MSIRERPSILYLVPGHDFLPSAGPTRNVLNQARAMRTWADVRLAFRRIVEPPEPGDPPVMEIAPQKVRSTTVVDDAATRGMSYLGFLAYLRSLHRFLRHTLTGTDVLLEKDWMLTGLGAWLARTHRVHAIAVKNWIATAYNSGGRSALNAARQALAARLEGYLLRRSACIVAETEILRMAIVARWRIPPDRIAVIGLGVDRELFRPGDPTEARARLGISPEAIVLLYTGLLDRTHDLEPILRALADGSDDRLELHIVGDGPRRAQYEMIARAARRPVVFHGRVPHAQVSVYVTAADLCVAPYDPTRFPQGEVGYSTLKVREYLSAGRAVATVASGSLRSLVRDGESGFLLDNDPESWRRLLQNLPEREQLRVMGAAAAASDLPTWGDVSHAFRDLCLRQLDSPLRLVTSHREVARSKAWRSEA